MRVISGSLRGRKLKEPTGRNIRPTTDKIKESVFNIVQFDIEGRKVLDLFAGTGQLGIEALSRGAKSAVFIDTAMESVKLIYENIKTCGFSEQTAVWARDALRYLESDEKFDLVFVDPPYDAKLADRAVSKIAEFDKLNLNGIIINEAKADSATTVLEQPYVLHKEYKYGTSKLVKYVREIC